jgi:hypothetical protein
MTAAFVMAFIFYIVGPRANMEVNSLWAPTPWFRGFCKDVIAFLLRCCSCIGVIHTEKRFLEIEANLGHGYTDDRACAYLLHSP